MRKVIFGWLLAIPMLLVGTSCSKDKPVTPEPGGGTEVVRTCDLKQTLTIDEKAEQMKALAADLLGDEKLKTAKRKIKSDIKPDDLTRANICDCLWGSANKRSDFKKEFVSGTNGYRLVYLSTDTKPAGIPATTYFTHEFIPTAPGHASYGYYRHDVSADGKIKDTIITTYEWE